MARAPDVSALANAAHELLRQGDAVGAERVLAPVFGQLGRDPSVLHLMGLIKKAQNQLAEAERHLRHAISFALSEGSYYNDLGVVLQARGNHAEAARVFRAAIALLPDAGPVRVNLVRGLIATGEYPAAEAEARAFINIQPSAESWTLLHTVQRAQERHAEALRSAETALQLAPKLRVARLNYAASLDRVGRTREAVPLYEGLVREDMESPDLALAFARALYGQDRKDDAEAVLMQAVELWSASTNVQGALARMRWLRGEGAKCTALLEAELQKRPNDLSLQLTCADVLHRGGHDERALAVVDRGLAASPDHPSLLTARGIVLDEVNRPEEALQAFHRALQLSPGAVATQRNMLSTLLRANRPEDCLAMARSMRQQAPDDQFLVACAATALRMMGDDAYHRFHDYARYVKTYDIPAPRGFFTADNFNASLAEALRAQHRVNAHPLDQTLTKGTQTGRSLLSSDEPNFRAFYVAIENAVRDYVGGLPDAVDDPVGRRRRDRQRLAACWSVRLTDGGFQPNHVHDQAWISSAYYVAITPAPDAPEKAGWLKFGEPHKPMRGCTPDHFIEPRVGMLVLFPSYMWHGTTPFKGSERLSMAFDLTPV